MCRPTGLGRYDLGAVPPLPLRLRSGQARWATLFCPWRDWNPTHFAPLAYLAAQPPDSTVGGQELSRETGIPKNYLSKILLVLGNAGIVEAVRGNAGGYRLSSAPEKVQLVRVVELFERHVAKRTCLLSLCRVCSDEDPCTAHHAWRPAKAAYFGFLETIP